MTRSKKDGDMDMRTLTGPSYWASYLVNGDVSGLADGEQAKVEAWLARELADDERIVDVARDEDGDGKDGRFTWSYDLYGGDCAGGEVIDYIVLGS